MPSTVTEVFAAAGIVRDGVVRWGQLPQLSADPDKPRTGIYIVSLSENPDSSESEHKDPPISPAAIDELLSARPELRLDGRRPSRPELAGRLSEFWIADEVILYIGRAGPRKKNPRKGEVAERVSEYYKTPLGARTPHAGGWPLKTLSCLASLHVHYAYCDRVKEAEDKAIGHFADRLSPASRGRLRDPLRAMPFANLEYPKGNPKDHGITGARAPRREKSLEREAASAPRSRRPRTPPAPGPSITPAHRSQNITANDIKQGQIRIPIGPVKDLFPPNRQHIEIQLKGRGLTCNWNPRLGIRERSGVIGIGKGPATELLTPGETLTITTDSSNGKIALD